MSAKILVLCEDDRTHRFLRRFLRHRFRNREIETLPLPTEGSGEQWVREQFPKQLRAVRDLEQTVLLVVTDADVNTTAYRRSQLDRQCDTEKTRPRQPIDPVIVAIPARNIETWLWHLKTGEAVDESRDYKLRLSALKTPELHELADKLFRFCHRAQRLLPTAPPSLRAACREYPILTRVLR